MFVKKTMRWHSKVYYLYGLKNVKMYKSVRHRLGVKKSCVGKFC